MDQNFQTSFIPKRPVVQERVASSRPVGLLTVISVLLVFTVVLASGGLYFYKGVLARNITQMENDLNLAKNRFEPAKIAELQVLDKRLSASSTVLAQHISITPVFKALEDVTMKTVRYTKFDYVLSDDPSQNVVIKLKGQAIGYRAIALQSDLFTENKNMIDPVFSNLLLDDKGNVIFDLEFSVERSFVDYKQNLATKAAGAQN